MPPPGGKRTSLASYTWGGFGSQNDITQFRNVFQPDQGIFSPGYPLVPPEHERVRVWDYPVGYNTIYTPRSYDPIGFHELRALAESHDITRLAIETRKDQIEKLDWAIRSRNEKQPRADNHDRISKLTEFWRKPDGDQPSRPGCVSCLRICWCWTLLPSSCVATGPAKSSVSMLSTARRSKY